MEFGKFSFDFSLTRHCCNYRKYDLKKRNYIGPTSLDHYLAFIMSNLGHVKKGSLVFDPFVGTGSILVAMAHLGAICMGGDIDARVLRGEMHAGCRAIKEKRGIFENFRIYGLPRPEIIRMDNHLVDRHLHRISVTNLVDGYFDAIVTDPPYGIRAGAKKSGMEYDFHIILNDDVLTFFVLYADFLRPKRTILCN